MQTADARLNKGRTDGDCLLVSDATPAVRPLPPRSNPPVFFVLFWRCSIMMRRHFSCRPELSPATCRTDAQFSVGCFSTLLGFSFFFFISSTEMQLLCQDLSAAPSCFHDMHSQDWSTLSLSDEFNGFSAAPKERWEVFLQFVCCWWKLVFLWLCF